MIPFISSDDYSFAPEWFLWLVALRNLFFVFVFSFVAGIGLALGTGLVN